MSLWRILVLGVVKMAIDCYFDRLGNLADRHGDMRMMLRHSDFGDDTTRGSGYLLRLWFGYAEILQPRMHLRGRHPMMFSCNPDLIRHRLSRRSSQVRALSLAFPHSCIRCAPNDRTIVLPMPLWP